MNVGEESMDGISANQTLLLISVVNTERQERCQEGGVSSPLALAELGSCRLEAVFATNGEKNDEIGKEEDAPNASRRGGTTHHLFLHTGLKTLHGIGGGIATATCSTGTTGRRRRRSGKGVEQALEQCVMSPGTGMRQRCVRYQHAQAQCGRLVKSKGTGGRYLGKAGPNTKDLAGNLSRTGPHEIIAAPHTRPTHGVTTATTFKVVEQSPSHGVDPFGFLGSFSGLGRRFGEQMVREWYGRIVQTGVRVLLRDVGR
mmetsp:Transcript_705/g.1629  ORF Transcript_705/g.1629 Transcript_705/m.1629 type:complete len:257 (-) Transcript_705:727-1497(-)